MSNKDITKPTPAVTEPQQLPDADVIGVGTEPDLLTEEERKRKQRKARILIVIAVIIAAIIGILIYRALTGHPPIPSILRPQLPHYSSSIYGTNRPMGVAVSKSGQRIYVTESDGKRLIHVYDPSGQQLDTLKPPGKSGSWRSPVYVAVDPLTDDVYVSDRLRDTVDIYSPTGAYRGKFKPSGRLKKKPSPLGLAFDQKGDLYMTDVGGKSHGVVVFDRDRKLLRKFGSGRQLLFPNGVAVDKPGNLYVSDSNHGRLAIFNPAGKLFASIRRGVGVGDLGMPRGVAITPDGRLYVVDTTNQNVKVYRVDPKGLKVPNYIGSFGREGNQNGMFEYPNGVAVDGSGSIYVTDRENGRVQIWRR